MACCALATVAAGRDVLFGIPLRMGESVARQLSSNLPSGMTH